MNNSISILTPTWNRAKYLKRVYESILAQDVELIEWIIVDDGSVDDTEFVVEKLMIEAPFPITYAKYSQRVGKCRADNTLIDLAVGYYILWCDSDDALAPGALAKMLKDWEEISKRRDDSCFAVAGRCIDQNGKIQNAGPTEYSPFFEKWGMLSTVHGIDGDMCIMFRRDIVGDRRFPEHDLVMSESGFWCQYYDYDVYCTPDILKVMIRDTKNRISWSPRMQYCRGKAYAIAYAHATSYYHYAWLKQIEIASKYCRYGIHGDLGVRQGAHLMGDKKTFLFYFGCALGCLLAIKDIAQNRVDKTHYIFEDGKRASLKIRNNDKSQKIIKDSVYMR